MLALPLLLGPLADFELTVHLPPQAPAELEALFWRVADPRDPLYARHHASASELSHLAGGAPHAVAAASAWLRRLGASRLTLSPLGDTLTAAFAAEPPHTPPHGVPRGAPAGALVTRREQSPPAASAAPPRLGAAAGYSISAQKRAYGLPASLSARDARTTVMVWGPGTFGYSPLALRLFKLTHGVPINLEKVRFDTAHHGTPGGDNFGEGSLDVRMAASFALNATVLVSNTNTSVATEEGAGFGVALLDFLSSLASRETLPQVLSLSLGSLSPRSCNLLCAHAAREYAVEPNECASFLQAQRQVCMFESEAQVALIDRALQVLGLRGVTVVGSSGDGGSHWSFGPFEGSSPIAAALNKVGCEFQFPIYPSPSPFMLSIGGTAWKDMDPSQPISWSGSGGGFSWQCPMPAFQREVVHAYLSGTAGTPPAASFNASGRAYPDVSAIAVEGTSESAPTVGGIFALAIDARLRAGLPPLGFVGTRVWQVAQQHPGEAFEDVTVGNSKTSCENGFPAAKGWDPVTGWGRIKWEGFSKYFAAAP